MSGRNREYSLVYNVKLEGNNVTVCKGFLLKVLQITEARMKTCQQALKVGAVATTENHGKHTNRPRRLIKKYGIWQAIKFPTLRSSVKDIINFMQYHKIPVPQPNPIKAAMMQTIRKANINKTYIVDELATSYGHEVLQLPPYHCVLNPIELDDNNTLSESAMRISYKICHEIAKELKTFNEGEFIKRCLIILADELCPHLLSKNLKVRIYKTVILPVVLCGCETWTLTLREEHRLRVFENKVLRKIFGAKRDEVTGEWRKLHNTELHALYSSPDIIRNIKFRRLRWAGHVARMGESRNAYRVLVGRPEGKRPLGRPRRRWEDNIKMDLREVRYDDRDWINLAQDRDQWRAYARAAMNLRITVYLTAESRPNSHSVKCSPCIMAVDLDIKRQRMCLTWSEATKGNIEGGEFGPVLWIEFGVAQWSDRLVRRAKGPGDIDIPVIGNNAASIWELIS
ncbi:hypothetical protein ANN_17018 [Periplaneta americana]|uniref:Uncharacterized protein n=1 Tax=Periplaneta americana TaxID=6978 RepID=A0ABQ8SRR3_PERAM|nr:hypothetical protein ANN_17018 [Periplaneta americana]